MTRVEWSRLAGDDVEATVAMFLSGVWPHAQRISPSRGDAGIDVLVSDGSRSVVHQVKSFTGPLTASQKRQVEKSMRALVTDPRVSNLKVDEWHLVTPWDPTLEARGWLGKLAAEMGLPEPIWDGLTQCDRWAATYPQIVDYYLHGNREHIERQVRGLLETHRIGPWAESGPPVDVDAQTLGGVLRATVEFLNVNDPFYAYAFSVSPATPSQQDDHEQAMDDLKAELANPPSADVVMTQITQHGSTRVRIDVYAKNAVATVLRPISTSGTFTATRGSEHEHALRDFATYGTPLNLPWGSYNGTSEAPGGLGGPIQDAAVVTVPVVDATAPHQEVRLIVLDESGDEIAMVRLHRIYSTTGIPDQDGVIPGMESVLEDSSETLALRWRMTTATKVPRLDFTFRPPCGKRPDQVLPALQVAAALRRPNTFVFAPAFGPTSDAMRQRIDEDQLLPPAPFWRDLALSLGRIQQHTSTPLTVPSAESLKGGTGEEILRTAAFLDGYIFEVPVTALVSMVNDEPVDRDQSEHHHLLMPLSVALPEEAVTCGQLLLTFAPDGVETVDTPEGVRLRWDVKDGRAIARLLTDDEAVESADPPAAPPVEDPSPAGAECPPES